MDISVRAAGGGDFKVLVKLYHEFYSDLRSRQGCRVEDIKEIEASVERYMSDPHSAIFLAFVDGVVAGFVRVSERDSCFWVEEIYVDPAYRRLGVGKSLMDRAEHYILERGERYVYAMLSPQNKGALFFLRNLGYTILNTIELTKPLEPIPDSKTRLIEILGSRFKTWRWLKEEYSDVEKEYLRSVEEFFRRGGSEEEFLQIVAEAIRGRLKERS